MGYDFFAQNSDGDNNRMGAAGAMNRFVYLHDRCRAKIILAVLYSLFKLTTALSAGCLTPPDNFLTSARFRLVDRRLASFGFSHSDHWRRNI